MFVQLRYISRDLVAALIDQTLTIDEDLSLGQVDVGDLRAGQAFRKLPLLRAHHQLRPPLYSSFDVQTGTQASRYLLLLHSSPNSAEAAVHLQ